ncbi:MAG TPA: hypothetical protein VKV26_18325 [Dehalococcoidia bacterium]|nr:hypothetical protein [Dehalococcoidia bacterium]
MDTAYQSKAWQVLFGAVAGAAAALLGPLFVALSLNPRQIMPDPAPHLVR